MTMLRSDLGLAEAYVAPRSETEKQLAEIWRIALNLDQVGVDDSFFWLPGNSLIAARIFAEIERVFGVLLTICRYVTRPYPGPAHIIATGDRAVQIGRPDWPWRKRILAGPRTLAKLDCDHGDLFGSHETAVFDWMKSKMATAAAVPPISPVRL